MKQEQRSVQHHAPHFVAHPPLCKGPGVVRQIMRQLHEEPESSGVVLQVPANEFPALPLHLIVEGDLQHHFQLVVQTRRVYLE